LFPLACFTKARRSATTNEDRNHYTLQKDYPEHFQSGVFWEKVSVALIPCLLFALFFFASWLYQASSTHFGQACVHLGQERAFLGLHLHGRLVSLRLMGLVQIILCEGVDM